MSTSNFCYDNRCVVVTNDDYECGNYPELGDYRHESLRSYPSHKLNGFDFTFWELVYTSGYYEHACIDYVPKPDSRSIYDFFSPSRYSSVKEFCDDLVCTFAGIVSKTKIRTLFSGLRHSGQEIYDFLVAKFEVFVEYAADVERPKVDAAIDKIKTDYGYEEYGVCARFSNSETWYSKIA